MADLSITSANAVCTLSVPDLFDTPITLEQWGSDQAWKNDAVQPVETNLTIDGVLQAGWVPTTKTVTFTLSPASPSKAFFDQLNDEQTTSREIYRINMDLAIPSLSERHTGRRGVLKSYKPIADGAKVLQPMEFAIEFEQLTISAL